METNSSKGICSPWVRLTKQKLSYWYKKQSKAKLLFFIMNTGFVCTLLLLGMTITINTRHVVSAGHYVKPEADAVMCVHKSIVAKGSIFKKEFLWCSNKSRALTHASVWMNCDERGGILSTFTSAPARKGHLWTNYFDPPQDDVYWFQQEDA